MSVEMADIVRETLRVRLSAYMQVMIESNAFLEHLMWERIDKVTVPEFIEGRARGDMKMKNGNIYRRIGSDGRSLKGNNRSAR